MSQFMDGFTVVEFQGKPTQVGDFRGWDAVAADVGVHRNTIRNWVKRGLFPAPRKIGQRTCLWSCEAVRQWRAGNAELIELTIAAGKQRHPT